MRVEEPPSPNFSVGPFYFDVNSFAADPALEPFRREFFSSCPGRKGVAAAACVSSRMAVVFPFGGPKEEFVDRQFDPARHLSAHMKGEPGHCLTRAAILSAELLSVGIPSRIVQILPRSFQGHTMVGVWDDGEGAWTLFDPTGGGRVVGPHGAISGQVLALEAQKISLRKMGKSPPGGGSNLSSYYSALAQAMDGVEVFYPEPWLYLRTGRRFSHWPFRGAFVRFGTRPLFIGSLLKLLRIAAVLCALGVALLCLDAVRIVARFSRGGPP